MTLQTTGAMSGVDAKIEISLNQGMTWTEDISGSTNQVTATEQRRQSGEAYTFVGDTAIVGSGKREPVEVGFRCVYTEESDEAWEIVRALFEAGDRIWIRWQLQAGAHYHTIEGGVITRFNYPMADTGDAAPVQCEFSVRAPRITVS